MTKKVTDEDFESQVLNSDIPVVVDFWAEWCGPCRMLGPILEETSKDLAGRVKILKMNVDENPKIPSSHGIRGIPTMIMFKGGAVVDTKVGVLQKPQLISWIESNI
jgi:thioredoxin 1